MISYQEYKIQKQICADLDKLNIPYWHFVNEGKRTPQNGARLKAIGLKPGVHDLFMPLGNKQFKGLWLEVKTLTGRATPEQIKFAEDMIKFGFEAKIAKGYTACMDVICQFYGF